MAEKRQISPERKRQLDELTALERRGRLVDAILLLDNLLAEAPDDYFLHFRKVNLAIYHDLPHEGLKAASDFASRFPGDWNSLLLLADANLHAGKAAVALEYLDEAEKGTHSTSRSRRIRVKALMTLGRMAEAQELSKIDQNRPNPKLDDLIAVETASPAATEAEMRQRATDRSAAGERAPRNAHYVASWYANHGSLEKAADLYAQAIEEDPDEEFLQIEAALLNWKRGLVDEALLALEVVFDGNPADARIATCVIDGYRKKGKLLKAWTATWRHSRAYSQLQRNKLGA